MGRLDTSLESLSDSSVERTHSALEVHDETDERAVPSRDSWPAMAGKSAPLTALDSLEAVRPFVPHIIPSGVLPDNGANTAAIKWAIRNDAEDVAIACGSAGYLLGVAIGQHLVRRPSRRPSRSLAGGDDGQSATSGLRAHVPGHTHRLSAGPLQQVRSVGRFGASNTWALN
jgi:hypothetical protein